VKVKRNCIDGDRWKGMSGRGFVTGQQLTDVGEPEKWYKMAAKQNDNTEKQKYIKSSKF